MKSKIVVGTLFILIFFLCIGIGFYITRLNQLSNTNIKQTTEISDGKVTDECTKEGEELLQANSTEKKVSPKAVFVIKRIYDECGHTTKNYLTAPDDAINKTEKEIKEIYKDWEIESFTNNEIVMTKHENGSCFEHYVLRDEDGQIVVYRIDEENQEKICERTGILTKYLPQTDKIQIQNGIFVNGKDALNRLLEDYE